MYRNEDILYELESVHIANFEVGLFLSSIEYSSIVYQMLMVTNVLVNSAVL